MLPDEYTGCVGGCDSLLMDTLGLRSLPRANRRGNTSISSHNNDPPDDGQGGGGQGIGRRGNGGGGRGRGLRRENNGSQHRISQNFPSFSSDDSGFGSLNSNRQTNSLSRNSNISRGSYNPSVHQSVPPMFHETNDENAIVCNCNLNAVLLTVRKEGPNTGRQFYSCSKPRGQGCNFYLWADDAPRPSGNQSLSQSSNNRQNSNTDSGFSRSNSSWGTFGGQPDKDDNPVLCFCQNQAVQRTVLKENQNKGRLFYKCSKPQGQDCNFFLWADESDNNRPLSNSNSRSTGTGSFGSSNLSQPSFSSQPSSSQFMSNQFIENQIQCDCSIPAKRLVTVKDGPNKGRPFYVCSKIRNEQCRFFKWADETDEQPDSFSSSVSWPSSSFGSSSNTNRQTKGVKRKAPGEPVKKRKCGVCGEEGHNRKNCPHNQL